MNITKTKIEYEIIDDMIYISGDLDNNLLSMFDDKNYDKSTLYYIDMSKVENISFEAVHIFIDKYNEGCKFMLVCCKDETLLFLYNIGVSNYFNIMGEFKEIDIKDYTEYGGGYCGKSYINSDKSKMIKIYDINFKGAKKEVYKEKAASLSLIRMGLMSPLSLQLIKTSIGYGLVYECLKNKISYSKLIERDKNDDIKLKEHASHMAKLIKKVHKTECDTRVFLSARELYKNIIDSIHKISEEMKKNLYNDLSQIEEKTTCIHGDFQMGNVVMSEGRDIIIDLPEFSYGSPYFDLGSMYAVCHSINREFTKTCYHNDIETFHRVWYHFVRAYFETEEENIIKEEEEKILLYARLRIARFMLDVGENDWYRNYYYSFVKEK